MPIIRVEMFEGRDVEMKSRIIKEVTDGYCRATGADPEAVHVVLTDVSKDDWGRGGVPFAERKLS